MLSTIALTSIAVTATLGALHPRAERFPMWDGFPNPSPSTLKQIEMDAGGNIPDSPVPTGLSNASHASIQLIGFIEALDAAFYDQLEYNLTTSQPGFDASSIPSSSGQNISLVADFVAQFRSIQQVHDLTAAAVANASGITPFLGCPEYIFPITNFTDALEFAIGLQTASVGTVSDISQVLVNNGDTALVRALTTIVAAEGQVTGYLMELASQVTGMPFENVPFATSISQSMFLSYYIQAIPDPAQCPGLQSLVETFPVFPQLYEAALPEPSNQDGSFTLEVLAKEWQKNETYFGVIINQISLPVVQNITNVTSVTLDGDHFVQFNLDYPFVENQLNGLIAIALTTSPGPFTDVDGVTNATAFGPLFLYNNV